jgi:hypothetical protein
MDRRRLHHQSKAPETVDTYMLLLLLLPPPLSMLLLLLLLPPSPHHPVPNGIAIVAESPQDCQSRNHAMCTVKE